ncbi:hypothetical protein MHA_0557 [Mannheimia haemolytica PHL213]|nr:hypothetical protein MHA_0557 [Mannheimia haemolytica PHL213]
MNRYNKRSNLLNILHYITQKLRANIMFALNFGKYIYRQ